MNYEMTIYLIIVTAFVCGFLLGGIAVYSVMSAQLPKRILIVGEKRK